jgi:hypothetical protein
MFKKSGIIWSILFGIGSLFYYIKKPLHTSSPINNNLDVIKFEKKCLILKKYLELNKKYTSNLGILIDMEIPSYQNRFFVFDFVTNKIIDKGLVAHGSGSELENSEDLLFSNKNNSYATSLGKYEIANSYIGSFGKAYKLIGLESSNDQAYLRNIVFHKYEKVPLDEQNSPICNSQGCPMVNEIFFKRIEKIIDAESKPIVMMIYYK